MWRRIVKHVNLNSRFSRLATDTSFAVSYNMGGRWFWLKTGAWKAEEGMLWTIHIQLWCSLWPLFTQFSFRLCTAWRHVLLCIIRYFDQYGILRDIVQSHLLQTIALCAMEPPVSLDGEDIRNEKVLITFFTWFSRKIGFSRNAHVNLGHCRSSKSLTCNVGLSTVLFCDHFWHLMGASPFAGQGP